MATLRPAPPPARAPAPIRGGYARHRGYTRLGHESAGDRVSTDVCKDVCVSVGRVYPSALWRMGDHQHASTSFGMRTSRSSSARLSCASVVVCLAPVNCVLSLSALARASRRPGPGERRLEMEFAPPEKARMQKAISVHQTCSLYPYTEMARARETNSTTSHPRGGPQHP